MKRDSLEANQLWKVVRQMVLERDGRRCQACGGWGGQVHHIVARRRGGSDDPSNLMTLCGPCHMLVSPVPDRVVCLVLRMKADDLPAARARVGTRIALWLAARGVPTGVAAPSRD